MQCSNCKKSIKVSKNYKGIKPLCKACKSTISMWDLRWLLEDRKRWTDLRRYLENDKLSNPPPLEPIE